MVQFNRLSNWQQNGSGTSRESNSRFSSPISRTGLGLFRDHQSSFQSQSGRLSATNHHHWANQHTTFNNNNNNVNVPILNGGINYPDGSYGVEPFFGMNMAPSSSVQRFPPPPNNLQFLHHHQRSTTTAGNYNNVTPNNYPSAAAAAEHVWNNHYNYNNNHQIVPSVQYSYGHHHHHTNYFGAGYDHQQEHGIGESSRSGGAQVWDDTCPCVGNGHYWGAANEFGQSNGHSFTDTYNFNHALQQAYGYSSSPWNINASYPMHNNFRGPSSSSSSNDQLRLSAAANIQVQQPSNAARLSPITARQPPITSQPPLQSEPEYYDDDDDDDALGNIYIGYISENDNRSMQRSNNNSRSRSDLLTQLAHEVQDALEFLRNGGPLPHEGFLMLDDSLVLTFQHLEVHIRQLPSISDIWQDALLDSDYMPYELLVELEQLLGTVGTGLEEEQILSHIGREIFKSIKEGSPENETCCICQEDYATGEELGRVDCGHKFHLACIKQWLVLKNTCPICKQRALAVDTNQTGRRI